MIELTRLNGARFTVNSDLIKYAEASPDTVLTLVTGEKLVVLESCPEIVQLTIAYRAAIYSQYSPEALAALNTRAAYHAASLAQNPD
jgi:flagellar protein FlbD